MVALLLVAVLLVAVVLISRRAQRAGVAPRSCCGGRPWPPDDLTGMTGPVPETGSATTIDAPRR